jgi:hypothetical protein
MIRVSLALVASLGLAVVHTWQADRTEIFVVSCTLRWTDVDQRERTRHTPYRSFRLEGQAEREVRLLNSAQDPRVSDCDYTYVLLEP